MTVAGNPPKLGVPYHTKAQLALVAKGMHDSAGVSYAVTFGYRGQWTAGHHHALRQLRRDLPDLHVRLELGRGPNTSTNTGVHTYGTGGSKSITLTVFLQSNGKKVGSATRSVTLANPDMPPVAAGTCTPDTNAWTMTITTIPRTTGRTRILCRPTVMPPEDHHEMGDTSQTVVTGAGQTVVHKVRGQGDLRG